MQTDGSKIINIIRDLSKQSIGISKSQNIFGIVKSLVPLIIQKENSIEIADNEMFLQTSKFTEKTEAWQIIDNTEGEPHSHFIPEFKTEETQNHIHKVLKSVIHQQTAGYPPEITDIEEHSHPNESAKIEIITEYASSPEVKPHRHIIKGVIIKNNIYWTAYETVGGDMYLKTNHRHNIKPNEPISTEINEGHSHVLTLPSKTVHTLVKGVLWNGLQVGDKVQITTHDNNQRYLIHRQLEEN
jgi:hypothetical protein